MFHLVTRLSQTLTRCRFAVGCSKIYGEINITNLALPYSALSGSAPGLVFSTIATLLLSWIFPDQNEAWVATRAISGAGKPEEATGSQIVQNSGSSSQADTKDEKVTTPALPGTASTQTNEASEDAQELEPALDRDELQRTFKRAAWISGSLTLIITIVRTSLRSDRTSRVTTLT